jgi:hypothetical protein
MQLAVEMTSHEDKVKDGKKGKNPMITTNYCKSAIMRVTLLLALTAASHFSSSALATTFDLSTLTGTYGGQNLLWESVGSKPSPAIVPTSIRELITFDGTGNFTMDQVINHAGTSISRTVTGTYTVNSNGTGEMSFITPSGLIAKRDFAIVNGGAQLLFSDDPGTVGTLAGVGTYIKQ